ncbi:MAG TPA: hypothetical protein VGC26_11240 [Afipia sp.]
MRSILVLRAAADKLRILVSGFDIRYRPFFKADVAIEPLGFL